MSTDSPPQKKRRRLVKRSSTVLDLTGDDNDSGTGPTPPKRGTKRKLDLKADTLLRQMAQAARAPAEPVKWPTDPDWPGVAEIGRTTGVQFITAADPGQVHMGIWRFQLYPEFKPTHVKVVNLHELAELRNKLQPEVKISHSKVMKGGAKRFGTRAINQALIWFMQREMVPGGLFDSQMLFVESQDFRLDMKSVETLMIGIFGASRPPVVVHGEEGGSRPSNQIVSGNSAKSCYGGLFPSVSGYQCSDEYEEMERTGAAAVSARKPRPKRGYGNVASTAANKRQYEQNKKNAKVFGPAIAHVERLREKMGAALTASDYTTIKEHIAKNKTDDIYDAMFIGLYAINTHLYQMYRYKHRFILKALSAVTAPPMRAKRQFEEVLELMQWCQATEADKRFVVDALFKK